MAVAGVLALTLSGCGLGTRADAAGAIARFLDAVHRGDKTAFEAGLDRAALRADLRDQLADLGRSRAIEVDGGPSEFALDRMITPQAFKLVEARTGRPLPMAPTAAQVALLMKVRDRNHVCLADPGKARCRLAFTRENGVWRLVGMQATDLTIEIAPAPAKNAPAKN